MKRARASERAREVQLDAVLCESKKTDKDIDVSFIVDMHIGHQVSY